MNMQDNILTAKNLVVGNDKISLVKPLNFAIDSRDYLCITGENGTGKSTLIKTFLGLQKPLAGSFDLLTDQVSYLPQQTDIQRNFPATVEEILMSAKGDQRGNNLNHYIVDYLKDLGLFAVGDKSFRTLSGGWQQRVLLGRALNRFWTGNGPRIFFLDEPTKGLDAQSEGLLHEIVEDLSLRHDTAIVMIVHGNVPNGCTKILTLSNREGIINERNQEMLS